MKTKSKVPSKVKDVITERPEGMDYKTYREVRKVNQKNIKNYLRGTAIEGTGTGLLKK